MNAQVAAQIQPLMPQIAFTCSGMKMRPTSRATSTARRYARAGTGLYFDAPTAATPRAGAPAASVSPPAAAILPEAQAILVDSLVTPAKNPNSVFSSNTIGENQR